VVAEGGGLRLAVTVGGGARDAPVVGGSPRLAVRLARPEFGLWDWSGKLGIRVQ
jgi:hypothetical protein